MLGVQTYYARAASPAHLLYPLKLHPTSSYQLYLIVSRSITIQDKKKEKDSDRFGSVTGEEEGKVTYDTGELRFFSRLSFAGGRRARAEPARSMLFPGFSSSKRLELVPPVSRDS